MDRLGCALVALLILLGNSQARAGERVGVPALGVDAMALLMHDQSVVIHPDVVPALPASAARFRIDVPQEVRAIRAVRGIDGIAGLTVAATTDPTERVATTVTARIAFADGAAPQREWLAPGELARTTATGRFVVEETRAGPVPLRRRRASPLDMMVTLRLDGDAESPPISVGGGAAAALWALLPK